MIDLPSEVIGSLLGEKLFGGGMSPWVVHALIFNVFYLLPGTFHLSSFDSSRSSQQHYYNRKEKLN